MERAADVLRGDDIGPAQVRIALHHILRLTSIVVVIDEFNEIAEPGTSALLSNLIKMLSDKIEPVTFVIVGVADDVDRLIANRLSINRNLSQIRMPRMNDDELELIALRGYQTLEMTAAEDVLQLIRKVPRGLPQYAHIIAQEGARQALMRCESEVGVDDVLAGLRVGLEKVDHTLSTAYDLATYSARPSRFKDVLLACALATPDQYGYFAPANVLEPYRLVSGDRTMDYANFNPSLVTLSQERGLILSRMGPERGRRYRFSDPWPSPRQPDTRLCGL